MTKSLEVINGINAGLETANLMAPLIKSLIGIVSDHIREGKDTIPVSAILDSWQVHLDSVDAKARARLVELGMPLPPEKPAAVEGL